LSEAQKAVAISSASAQAAAPQASSAILAQSTEDIEKKIGELATRLGKYKVEYKALVKTAKSDRTPAIQAKIDQLNKLITEERSAIAQLQKSLPVEGAANSNPISDAPKASDETLPPVAAAQVVMVSLQVPQAQSQPTSQSGSLTLPTATATKAKWPIPQAQLQPSTQSQTANPSPATVSIRLTDGTILKKAVPSAVYISPHLLQKPISAGQYNFAAAANYPAQPIFASSTQLMERYKQDFEAALRKKYSPQASTSAATALNSGAPMLAGADEQTKQGSLAAAIKPGDHAIATVLLSLGGKSFPTFGVNT
jgi:hypothetical protein